jgi:hypothetical protein
MLSSLKFDFFLFSKHDLERYEMFKTQLVTSRGSMTEDLTLSNPQQTQPSGGQPRGPQHSQQPPHESDDIY